MMSSSVPVSALNCSTASRRLPLPRPPSRKVVGVSVVGTQRPSKTSTNGRSTAVVRRRVMDVAPKKVRRFAAPVGTTTAQYERRPRPTQGQQEIFLGEQGRLPGFSDRGELVQPLGHRAGSGPRARGWKGLKSAGAWSRPAQHVQGQRVQVAGGQ